jgi:hypothetical protein
MALTTYTIGEVLTAASLNDNLAYAVTVPAAVPGGLTLISATAVSAASSVSVNNCFTSTYDNYRLLFSPSACTSECAMTFRLRVSSTDSSTGYLSQRVIGYGTTVSTLVNVAGTDEMIFGNVNANNPTKTSVSVDIFSPAQARATVATSLATAVDTDNFIVIFGNSHSTATAYDGFTMLGQGGNFTGTIYLYGYAKA